MSLAAGIDVGAAASKAVVIDEAGQLQGRALRRSGADFAASGRAVYYDALAAAGAQEEAVEAVFATGYGRKNLAFVKESRTEISCHARGAYFHFPRALSVVDIGGQDAKVIKVNGQGVRTSFKMNRKCAAGTGAFLEEMALRLDLELAALNDLAAGADQEATLGAFCTVFTATEVLAKIRQGVPVAALVKGLFRSVLKRVSEMDVLTDTVVLTGGVAAHNPFLVEMMSQELGQEVVRPPHAQFTGALGAALFALDQIEPEAA